MFDTTITSKCCGTEFVIVTEKALKINDLVRCKGCNDAVRLSVDNSITSEITLAEVVDAQLFALGIGY